MAEKKPRTAKQIAQFEAAQAKRWADHKADKARRAGVDTTAGAGDDPSDLPPGAPKVTTTPYSSVGDSPEQKKRKAEGEPAPEPPPETPGAPAAGAAGTDSGAAPKAPDPKPSGASRKGLLGLIADGLGL